MLCYDSNDYSEVLLPDGQSLGLPLVEGNSAPESSNVLYFIPQGTYSKNIIFS